MCASLLAVSLTVVFVGCRDHVPAAPVDTGPPCGEISDWTGLLPDSLMTIPELRGIPSIDEARLHWIQDPTNSVVLRSLESENFDDLRCLEKYLAEKKIIQLGESSHGCREFNQVRVRLIKYLHEELGYDVIAFESNLFECFWANEHITELDELLALRRSIYRSVWGTEEVVELYRYMKESWKTERPLILAGFDCQFSSVLYTIRERPSYLENVVSRLDPTYARTLRAFDSLTIRRIWYDPLGLLQSEDSVRAAYMQAVNLIESHLPELDAHYPGREAYPRMVAQSMRSTLHYIDELREDYIGDGNTASYAVRDAAMAENVMFLKEKAYPDKKIILWAHNYHVGNSVFNHALYPDIKNMGVHLSERYGKDLYTVGSFMLRGRTKTDWNFTEINVPLPSSTDAVETILYHGRRQALFVDMQHQRRSPGNSWMFTTSTARTSGFAAESFIPRLVYDGIIFIDSSSVPVMAH